MSDKIKKVSDNEDRINVYREGRKIRFFHEINEDSICEFYKVMDEIEREKNNKSIEIEICTGGGNVYDGLAIYDRIRRSEYEIITIASGYIASMGLIIFLAGDYRKACDNSTFMSHQHSEEYDSGETRRRSDIEIENKENKRLDDLMNNIISEHTGQPLRKIINEVKPGDYYFNAEIALNEGYVHEIIPNKQIIKKYRRRKK